MKKVLAFSGSNSSKSLNQSLINYVAKVLNAEQKEVSIEVIDIRDYPMPIYSIDIEKESGYPEPAKQLQSLVFDHDALLIACPENNGAMPAIFKNMIDWISRMVEPGKSFFGEAKKPVFLLSASPGPNGGSTNLTNLAKLMPRWGADVKGNMSIGKFHKHISDEGLDEETQALVLPAVRAFIQEL